MESISFVGGVFLFAKNPKALANWYREFLGIETEDYNGTYYHEFLYRHQENPKREGRLTWSIMPAGELPTEHKTAQVNYQVEDLDRFVTQLEESGIKIQGREEYDYGKFAWVLDPEGNRIELFEDKEF